MKKLPQLSLNVVATALFFLAVGVLGGCASAPRHSFGPATIRVMTYNIHHAQGLDGRVDLDRIAATITKEQADIVALQEVDKSTERTARRDFPAEFARLTGMHCVFSNNFSFQGGQYGNAILTRFPVENAHNLALPMLGSGEQRGLLRVTLNIHGKPLIFMDTHLDHRRDDAERLASAEKIIALFETLSPAPVILCGDFNDVPGSRLYQKLAGSFDDAWTAAGHGDGFTIPAARPAKRIDYVWISKNARLKAISISVPPCDGSDHLPVVTELQWVAR